MRKVFYAIILTLSLCAAASPQTRRTTQTGARPNASAGASKPAATQQKPAATTATPAGAQQTQANSNTPSSTVAVDCGCEAGPLPDVLATVNGIKITKADLTPEVQQQIQQIQQD